MSVQDGKLRGHSSILIEEFNGIWKRGDADSVPLDHFTDAQNLLFVESGVTTRPGIDTLTVSGGFSLPNVLQVKPYRKTNSESLLVLDNTGSIYDTGSPTPLTPILTISGMIDFGFYVFAGRAYISPTADQATGMLNQFVYVYKGDGTLARKAAGDAPIGTMTAAAGAAGNVQAGYHIFGVVYETDTGFFTQIGPDNLAVINASGTTKVDLSGIPVSPDTFVVQKHLVATKFITPASYTGNTRGYDFFFIPNGTIANGTTTATVNFYDIELLDDASYLLTIFSEIPAGVGLDLYKGRMINWTQEPDDEHRNILVSKAGEPEVFDEITGLIQIPSADETITVCKELREVLYIFTEVQTYAIQDNGEEPADWGDPNSLNQGLGSVLHGIATSLDLGGVSVDFLIIANFSGIYLFNGLFQFPELSYKIADLWTNYSFSQYVNIQFCNDTILKRLYIIAPDQQSMFYADYQHGLDLMKIRWMPWVTNYEITSICLQHLNELVIASAGPLA